jgi:hypothetical protein
MIDPHPLILSVPSTAAPSRSFRGADSSLTARPLRAMIDYEESGISVPPDQFQLNGQPSTNKRH